MAAKKPASPRGRSPRARPAAASAKPAQRPARTPPGHTKPGARGGAGRTARRGRPPDAERARLEDRLREAEDTLDAIRGGHVDALVVHGEGGEQVFTLRGADHRYRQLVETMTEGALLIDRDATIVYGNARFAALVDVPLERLIGSRLGDYFGDGGSAMLGAVLAARDGAPAKAELELVTPAGARLPVYLSATASWDVDGLTCVIATDLSAQRRDQALVAAERLTSRIVEQSAEGVVVVDVEGRVIRASQTAQRASGGTPLLQPFAQVFQIRDASGGDASRALLDATRRGETVSGRELTLAPASGDEAAPATTATATATATPTTPPATAIDVLVSAAPVLSRDGEPLGAVISFVDITERKRLAAERLALLEAAQAARADAEAANRAKDEFLAMLGHELRNPLAPILTALELMRARTGGGAVPHEQQIIERQVQHVVTLVDDLLDVSRITRGKIELDRRPLELAPIVARALELAGPLIEERGHRLELDVPAAGLALTADATRLCQVLSNLLVNAAKYTQRQGVIGVRAFRDAGHIVVQVRDNGMGIPADILPHLFERFVQGRRTIDRAEGGLGLGLAIVRSLVALHGGSVVARSEGHGRGSEFELRLPALDGDAARIVAAAVTGASANSAAVRGAPASRAAEPGATAGAATARRVLVVDDNVDAADLLSEALEQLGYVTRVANDGVTALSVAAELEPEIAVLDIGLPGMDGFELARRLRLQTAATRVPRLIALTGYGQESDRRRSAEAGFDAHLVKPVDLRALTRTIERLVG